MRTTSYKAVTEETGILKFVDIVANDVPLKENEYFALMVEDDDYPRNLSPHVKGIDLHTQRALVGIERTDKRPYISKEYSKRRSPYRGTTIIVEVEKDNLEKCCNLSK